ncbi:MULTISPECIES: hypothetical protein [Trichocoleus]|uniref:Uncharacterized protein n=1 Tax=Trichocoleus desertorum GB2-A4 TaxID=2933944 RepID=A0ABV0J1Y5_9CYAN|nr:hypothetical protein [Trichocoleus sp. FACHB-46]MBD1860396.1 hypothetical protein [Trichocoleus sp. FACHB-46]
MNMKLEQWLTVGACLGCTVSITAMLAIALQSDIAPQRISLSLGLPVVDVGAVTQLETATVALEPLQIDDLVDVDWLQSLEPTAVSQSSTGLEDLSLPEKTWEAELVACSSTYNSRLMLFAACELEFLAPPARSIAAASADFPTPSQLLGNTLLRQNLQEYQ